MSTTPTQSAAALFRAWKGTDSYFGRRFLVSRGADGKLLAALLELVEAQREALKEAETALTHSHGGQTYPCKCPAHKAVRAALALTETPDEA